MFPTPYRANGPFSAPLRGLKMPTVGTVGERTPPAGADRSRPKTHLVWGILATLLFCQLLGIVSIVYAVQVNKKWQAGDVLGAEAASRNARRWAWVSFAAGLLLFTICLIVNLMIQSQEGALL